MGYLSASIRTVADARVGDTITHYARKADNSLPGYEEATPMVFCGLFPVDADQYWYIDCTLFSDEQKIVLLLMNVSGVNHFLSFVLLADFLSYEMHLRSFNSMMLHWRWPYTAMLENSAFLFLGFQQEDIICIFLYMLSYVGWNFLFNLIVFFLVIITFTTIYSPFL